LTVVDPDFVAVGSSAQRELPPSMIERLTRILESFDSGTARLTLEEVTIRSGLPRSTVHRILDQLVRLEWVDHAPFGYCLGSRALGLGGDVNRDRIRESAAPFLHELAMQTGAVVHLEVLDGASTYCLDKIGGPRAGSVPTRVGGRVHAHATAGGKAMLATLDPEHVDALCPPRPVALTPHTITDRVVLHQELNRIRKRRGVAFERDEANLGVVAVGAPLRGANIPLASVSLAGDARAVHVDWIAPLVADVARRISHALTGTDPAVGAVLDWT